MEPEGEQPTLASFSDLLVAARHQQQPQRLLFVFARKFVDEKSTRVEREQYRQHRGGLVEPRLTIDKLPAEVPDFDSLCQEPERAGTYWWDIVFVSSMSGHDGIAPSSADAVQPLQFMVSAINEGNTDRMAAFDRRGEYLQIT